MVSGAARIEAIQFSDGIVLDEAATKWAQVVSVTTGSGNRDVLYAAANSDNRVYALGGNDTLYGATQSDLLDGGPGQDDLYGRDGADTLYGGVPITTGSTVKQALTRSTAVRVMTN